MNQSLEKIVIIGLNLTLLVTVGVPLLFTTSQVILVTDQSLTFQQFINDIDETVLTADQSQTALVRKIIVPNNVSLEAEFNQLIFKVYLDSWYIITRTYRCVIFLTGPRGSGVHILTINASASSIQIVFEPA